MARAMKTRFKIFAGMVRNENPCLKFLKLFRQILEIINNIHAEPIKLNHASPSAATEFMNDSQLPNDTKIKVCNAFVFIGQHCGECAVCKTYITCGDGDLCDKAKNQIAVELAYAGTDLEFCSLRGVKD